ALIYALLDGIAKKRFTYEPFDENIYAFTKAERAKRGIGELPTNLEAALDELEKDELIQKSLGTLYQKLKG
ncbi:MAG: glutamine synthetase, partial [Candidatus Aminicenantes bacterium]|nr:glutamine synthetase [Candidatus Aminicenantes bacterium]